MKKSRKGKSDYSVDVIDINNKRHRLNYTHNPTMAVNWLVKRYSIRFLRAFAYNRHDKTNWFMGLDNFGNWKRAK